MSKQTRLLFCSHDDTVSSRLAGLLAAVGTVMREPPRADAAARWLDAQRPHLVLLDFLAPDMTPDQGEASSVAQVLSEHAPALPLIAVCRYAQPQGAIAALRAGVREIVDIDDSAGLIAAVERLLMARPVGESHGAAAQRSVLLMGARAGMGVSTLAVHMAAKWQERLTRRAQPDAKPDGAQRPVALRDRVGILDLGMPVGDCQLYLDVNDAEFDFVDAAKNLRRLDETLLSTAVAHDAQGVSVLAWPRDLQQVQEVSHADSLLLYERLREQFGVLITDVGGFYNPRFMAAMAQSAGAVLIVTDQSLGALVSLADLLRDLTDHGVPMQALELVINRYDERYGMSAEQITERFGLPLRAVIPDRMLALRESQNQGALLHVNARRDPYVKAVAGILDGLDAQRTPGDDDPWDARRWLTALRGR